MKICTSTWLNNNWTIGVIVDAKLAGIIPSIKPILSKIKSTNFRITEQLELLILKLAGE